MLFVGNIEVWSDGEAPVVDLLTETFLFNTVVVPASGFVVGLSFFARGADGSVLGRTLVEPAKFDAGRGRLPMIVFFGEGFNGSPLTWDAGCALSAIFFSAFSLSTLSFSALSLSAVARTASSLAAGKLTSSG